MEEFIAGAWKYLAIAGAGIVSAIVFLVMRWSAKKKGASEEATRRVNAGRAAEAGVAESDRKIAADALNRRLEVRDTLRERLSREPTEAEVRALIEESKK